MDFNNNAEGLSIIANTISIAATLALPVGVLKTLGVFNEPSPSSNPAK